MTQVSATDAPNPDLRDLLLKVLNTGGSVEYAPQQVRVVRQRTLRDCPSARTGRPRQESALVAIAGGTKFVAEHIVLLWAAEDQGEWKMVAFQVRPLGAPPLKPYLGAWLGGHQRVVLGAIIGSQEVEAVRVRLGDGSVVGDAASSNAILIFECVQPAQLGDATVSIVNRDGSVIATEQHRLRTHEERLVKQ